MWPNIVAPVTKGVRYLISFQRSLTGYARRIVRDGTGTQRAPELLRVRNEHDRWVVIKIFGFSRLCLFLILGFSLVVAIGMLRTVGPFLPFGRVICSPLETFHQ